MAKKKEETKITKAETDEKVQAATEEKQDPEKRLALSCQGMVAAIIEWTLDSLMYSNIMLISKKMNISMEEAAAILDVGVIDLARISLVYAAYSKTPEAEKAAVLGKYSERIKDIEPEKKTRARKTTSKGKETASKGKETASKGKETTSKAKKSASKNDAT